MKWMKKSISSAYAYVENDYSQPTTIRTDLLENLIYLRKNFGKSADFVIKETKINNINAAYIFCDGMCDNLLMAKSVLEPIERSENLPDNATELMDFIRDKIITDPDEKEVHTLEEASELIISGFIVIFIDGLDRCLACGVQGYEKRSIEDPNTETQERGSKEGFIESIKVNMTLIRRRFITPQMRFDEMRIGTTSKTKVCVCYLADRAKPEIVDEVKSRLKKATLDMVLASGFLEPFLDQQSASLFTAVGITERPDTFCAKLSEGRVGILVDGTPFALFVPYLFIENFHSFDDYANRAYYSTFIRILKAISFVLSVVLPGIYVAIGCFNLELFPDSLIYDIAKAETRTPFPLMLEALLIHFIYEIVREAGLRLPRPVGQTVSFVGALVIGEATVTAGLIAAPMLVIVALTAVSSFIVPNLYEAVAILRFAFIIIGGLAGFYGIMIGLAILLVNMCSINPYGVPYMAPISPFEVYAFRDALWRRNWTKLGKHKMKIQDLKGTEK